MCVSLSVFGQVQEPEPEPTVCFGVKEKYVFEAEKADAIIPGDFNGDDIIDFMVSFGWGGVINLGLGDGGLSEPFVLTNNFIYALKSMDLDGDGMDEIISVESQDGYIFSVYKFTENRELEMVYKEALPGGTGPIVQGDFDGDGFTDIAISCEDTDHIYVLYGVAEGYFTAGPKIPVEGFSSNSEFYTGASIASADLNNNGFDDLIAVLPDLNLVRVFYGAAEADVIFFEVADFSVKTFPVDVKTGDFNADGFQDLAVTSNVDGYLSLDAYLSIEGKGFDSFVHVYNNDGFPFGPIETGNVYGTSGEDYIFMAPQGEVDELIMFVYIEDGEFSSFGRSTYPVEINFVNSINIGKWRSSVGDEIFMTNLSGNGVLVSAQSEKVEFEGINENYCQNDLPVKLAATPGGGVFYVGQDVMGEHGTEVTVFDPEEPGEYQILYLYTNEETNCISYNMKTVTVHQLPYVYFDGLEYNYCQYDTLIALKGYPAGGYFTFGGVEEEYFNPKNYEGYLGVSYIYENTQTGCRRDTTLYTEIFATPSVSLTGLDEVYCLADSVVELTPEPLPDGEWSLSGVEDFSFNLLDLTVDEPTRIVYYFEDGNTGCGDSTVIETIVKSLPVVEMEGLLPGYCYSDVINVNGYPEGGVFKGEIADYLNSTERLPAGEHTLTYVYTDSDGCTDDFSSNFIIRAEPDISIASDPEDAVVCAGETATLTATGAYSYTWPDGSDSPEYVFSGTETTTILLEAADIDWCRSTAEITVTVLSEEECNPNVEPDEFRIVELSEQIAGEPFAVEIKAYHNGRLVTNFDKTIGLAYSTSTEEQPVEVTFSEGVALIENFVITKADSSKIYFNINDDLYESKSFYVRHGELKGFAITNTNGQPLLEEYYKLLKFQIKITAIDKWGNVVQTYNDKAKLSSAALSNGQITTEFVDGVCLNHLISFQEEGVHAVKVSDWQEVVNSVYSPVRIVEFNFLLAGSETVIPVRPTRYQIFPIVDKSIYPSVAFKFVESTEGNIILNNQQESLFDMVFMSQDQNSASEITELQFEIVQEGDVVQPLIRKIKINKQTPYLQNPGCVPEEQCSELYIKRVRLGEMTVESDGCDIVNYKDYSAEVVSGSSFLLGTIYGFSMEFHKAVDDEEQYSLVVWIDLNNNTYFGEYPGEEDELLRFAPLSDNTYTSNITIPQSEYYTGPKRMRVALIKGTIPIQGCDFKNVVDVKDYYVHLEASSVLKAASVVTPNGDGKNDYFEIRGINPESDNELRIFDRTGKIMYVRNNYENDWSGYFNGTKADPGTYYYIFTNGDESLKGFFEVIY